MDFIQGVIGTVLNSELGLILNMHLKTGIKLSEDMPSMDLVYQKFLNTCEGMYFVSMLFVFPFPNLF